jgi:hypothetical protein
MARRILVHALIISGNDGNFLVSVVRNPEMDETVLAGFISALNMFGSQTLGNVGDISISGLGINLLVINKWGLHIIGILDSDLPELNFREGCENALQAFYEKYVEKLEKWDGRLKAFSDFKPFLEGMIQGYFVKLKEYRKNQPEFFEEGNDRKPLSSEDMISALQGDLKLYQEANETLHVKLKRLEDEKAALKTQIDMLELETLKKKKK